MSRNPASQKKIEATAAPTRIKVLSLGSCGSGKSCLIKRYCEERFVSKYITTIGVDYGVKPVQIDGCEVRVNFWDLSGE
jgi:DnaJ family protein C protein 27